MRELFIRLAASLSLFLAVPAFAADEQDIEKPAVSKSTFGYHQQHSIGKFNGVEKTEHWVTAKSGMLRTAFTHDFKKVGSGVSFGLAEITGLKFLKPFYFEGEVSSYAPAFGLVGLEVPLTKPLTLFVAGLYNDEHNFRYLGGPIFYWSQSHSSLLFYSSGQEQDGLKTISAVSLRNRVRELSWLGVDLDGTMKVINTTKGVEKVWGGKVQAMVGPVGVFVAHMPFADGSQYFRTQFGTSLQVGF